MTKFQKVIAEWDSSGYWRVMTPDGVVREFETADKALRFIERRDRYSVGHDEIRITSIEYRNVPEGFVLPHSEAS